MRPPQARLPFDALRDVDDDGEHWMARDLMARLGYIEWRKFEGAIERAKFGAMNSGAPDGQFIQFTQLVGANNLGQ